MADVSLKLSAKDIYEKTLKKRWLAVIVVKKLMLLDDIITDYQKMADMNNEVVRLSEENNKLKKKLKN